jgi:polyisoprenoid-binding protein YceI
MIARITGWLGFALCLGALPAAAQPRQFTVEPGSQVQFVSEAPLERITGTSSGVTGVVLLDPKNPVEARGEIAVPVASIRTGIDLRDEHLRSDSWLDAGRNPEIVFALRGVTMSGELVPNTLIEPTVIGTLEVHGIARSVSSRAKVRFTPASAPGERDVVRIQASFVVHLKDHAVSIPSIVALKVSPDIKVNVDLRVSAKAVAAAEPVAQVPVEPAPVEPAPREAVPAPNEKPLVAKPGKQPKPAQPVAATEKPVATKPTAKPAEPALPKEEAQPAAKPVVQMEPEEQLKHLLRQAHYYLAHGKPELAILSVQHAQAVLPLVEKKLAK